MKYIDAEKLNKSVNRYRDNAKAAFNPIEDDADYYKGKIDACKDIQDVITSLQQEQPEPPGYDKALLDVKRMVDKLYEEASIGLNEYDSGLYNGIAETCMKLRGFIMARCIYTHHNLRGRN